MTSCFQRFNNIKRVLCFVPEPSNFCWFCQSSEICFKPVTFFSCNGGIHQFRRFSYRINQSLISSGRLRYRATYSEKRCPLDSVRIVSKRFNISMRTFSSYLNLGCASNPARSLNHIFSIYVLQKCTRWWLIPAQMTSALLLEYQELLKCCSREFHTWQEVRWCRLFHIH